MLKCRTQLLSQNLSSSSSIQLNSWLPSAPSALRQFRPLQAITSNSLNQTCVFPCHVHHGCRSS
ncbi:hypothetical protein K474DRAFT_1515243 [Panus rudis PR-1116 ss-1]|nr:hypothetical protein K474DRAFT_1515243 [Panus rudis PR-1116 ss-1]